jgi:hypothetical protein
VASVDGPIVKDKHVLVHVAYEGQRENGGLPQLGYVPTQADIKLLQRPAINPVIRQPAGSQALGHAAADRTGPAA